MAVRVVALFAGLIVAAVDIEVLVEVHVVVVENIVVVLAVALVVFEVPVGLAADYRFCYLAFAFH